VTQQLNRALHSTICDMGLSVEALAILYLALVPGGSTVVAVLNLAVPIVQVTGTFVSPPQEVFEYPIKPWAVGSY